MDVMHHIFFNSKKSYAVEYFKSMGIELKEGPLTSGFDIGENDERWHDIRKFIDNYSSDITDFQGGTCFTEAEIENADFFTLRPARTFGYPQPTDNFAYQNITYDSTDACRECGAGFIQVSPFLIKRNPKWGRYNITQLGWVYDEYFVSASLKSQLEKETIKFNFRPVYKYRKKFTSEQLDDIFQLKITQSVDLDMSNETAAIELCDACKQKKYNHHTRGFFPAPKNENFTIAHSKQYFGTFRRAEHCVLINKDVYKLFKKLGVRGVSYKPCCKNNKPTEKNNMGAQERAVPKLWR